MKLISFNVNGIRAIEKKGFFDWVSKENPDILALQETKAHPDQLTETILKPKGYTSYWSSAEKKGYSGVAIYTKQIPKSVVEGLGILEFDSEGRTLIAEYDDFILFNIYYPNGSTGNKRVPFKMRFYDAFLDKAESLRKKGKSLIICGDVNTAHTEIDLARPKENAKNTGFLPEERAWVTKFIEHGYVDTFRHFTKEGGHYSWWDYYTGARARDVGWRIDYFFITKDLLPRLKKAWILKDVMGSDHCPVAIEIK
ncbi:MAG: exodeoxyribonuclease III [Candidatus Omnitrophica bacterium]|nr:exodeoxyribonuclease III [Candidatus Omnitrophota bacterium]